MKPNQAKNTVFEDLNDEKIIEKLDFTKLEEMFKLSTADSGTQDGLVGRNEGGLSIGQHSPGSTGSGAAGTTKKNTLLDTKRLQNVAITRRKLAMDPRAIMAAVHQLDLNSLSADKVDILSRILPTDEERKIYAERGDEGLSDEDRFMAALCEIERLEHKLSVMKVMSDFDESAALLEPQFTHVTAASKCAREASHFHRVLEVILAFGNYMNSGRKGSVYGFKLSSLDSVRLPLIINILHSAYYHGICSVQWDSVLSDMKELESGFEMARKERMLKGSDCPPSLDKFLLEKEERMNQLREHARLAATFECCVEFYGESPRTTPPNIFFSKLAQFVANFNRCKQENDSRIATEKQHNGMMQELAEKIGGNKRQRPKIDCQQMGHGDFEKIMSGLKQTYVTGAIPTPPRRKVSASPSPVPRTGPPVAPKTRVVAVDRDRQ
uniref:FH2 domain-containing protein n=1 Tax=Heterorhabditis bacteriophora TaxID=37862 RepID=A0A1I7XS30_HETBA